jgi:uncharacterized membrane protein YfcA
MDLQIIWYFVILLVVGMVAGFTSGLFGIGGGIVLVPTLMTVLPLFHAAPDLVMHMAIGTSLALIFPGSMMASRKQFQLGNLDLKLFYFWIQTVALGIILGSVLINYISNEQLKIYFAVYLLVVTLYAIFQREPPPGVEKIPLPGVARLAGLIVGVLSVLLGIGGGTFTVPFFHFSHYPLKKAIALSSATGVVISFAGAIGVMISGWGQWGLPAYSVGYLHLPAFLILTPGMMIFAPLGARAAHHLPTKALKIFYIGFLALMTGYMFWNLTAKRTPERKVSAAISAIEDLRPNRSAMIPESKAPTAYPKSRQNR